MSTSLYSSESYSTVGWKIIQDSRSLAENTRRKRWHVHHVAIALLEQSEGCSVNVLRRIGINVGEVSSCLRGFVAELEKFWEQEAQRIAQSIGYPPDYLFESMVTPTYGLMQLETVAKSIMTRKDEEKISSLHLLVALHKFTPVGYEDYLAVQILEAFAINYDAVTSTLQNQ